VAGHHRGLRAGCLHRGNAELGEPPVPLSHTRMGDRVTKGPGVPWGLPLVTSREGHYELWKQARYREGEDKRSLREGQWAVGAS